MPRARHRRLPLLTQATASFAAILVLVLTVLAASPELHERLHGHGPESAGATHHAGSRPAQGLPDDDDGCVVTLFAQGVVLPLAILALAFAGRVLRLIEVCVDSRFSAVAPRFLLLPSQAPPLGLE
jgi:hypothetical protein